MTDPCLFLSLLATAQNQDTCPAQPLEIASRSPKLVEGAISLSIPEVTPPEINPIQIPQLPDLKFLEPQSPFEQIKPLREPSIIPLSPPPEVMAYVNSQRRGPKTGPQMFEQRLAALEAGRTYTRLALDSFGKAWKYATAKPTYEDWKYLLKQEAQAISTGQGENRLNVLLGDSLSLWFPPEQLPTQELWLNQGISGDNTTGILKRLNTLNLTNPDRIYLMAGINDLRQGQSDENILNNYRKIVQTLRQDHPQTQIVLQSILPTRFAAIPNSRIAGLNQQLARIAAEEGANYLDLQPYFRDYQGNLRRDLTTDGLHLNPRGYAVWQWALQIEQI